MKQRPFLPPASIAATVIVIGLSGHAWAAANLDPFARNLRSRSAVAFPHGAGRGRADDGQAGRRRNERRRPETAAARRPRPPPSGASGRTAHPANPRALRARPSRPRDQLVAVTLSARWIPSANKAPAIPSNGALLFCFSARRARPSTSFPSTGRAGAIRVTACWSPLLALLEPRFPHPDCGSLLLASRGPSQTARGHGRRALLADATARRAIVGGVAVLLPVDQVRLGRTALGLIHHR